MGARSLGAVRGVGFSGARSIGGGGGGNFGGMAAGGRRR
jgi:hypothetical protein